MGRVLGLILAAVAAAAAFIFLIGIDGYTRIEFDGKVMEPPTSALLILLLVLAMGLVFGTTIFGWLARLPGSLRRRREAKQRDRGMVALTRGLEAVAAGDAEDAQHHARLASRTLDQTALTRLLTAQAAQLAGDDETAQESYAAMLESPETEFLGLRGLYLQAMHRGDKDQAKAYADRAFRLRPGAPWAFDSVYQLSVERGQWGDAYEALRLARKQGAQTGEEASRKAAALLTARAYTARDAGDDDAAREDAEDAIKHDAGLAPAAVLAARLEARAGKKSRAAKTLESAWAQAPHPALVAAMRDVYEDSSTGRRIARLRKMAKRNPEHRESQLLEAELLLEEGKPDEAKAALEPLLLDQPGPRTFTAMAEAMSAIHGEAAGEVWLERAAEAPRDPVPGSRGQFALTTEGWQRLIREYGEHGRLAPPPLEAVDTSLAREDLLALTAAPSAAAAPTVEASDDDNDDVPVTAPIGDVEDGETAEEATPIEPEAAEAAPVAAPEVAEAAPVAAPEVAPVTEAGGDVETAAPVPARPERQRRFGAPFRRSGAEAEAQIDEAVGPEMRDEALVPARDDAKAN